MKRFTILFCLILSSLSYSSPIVLRDLDGKNIPFESLKGKWIVINYWANWCSSCLEEISEFNQFYKNNKSRVALFAVNFDDLSRARQSALIRKYNINYPSLKNNPAGQLNLGDIRGVPATFVFNPQGKLSATLYGPQTSKSLNKATQ